MAGVHWAPTQALQTALSVPPHSAEHWPRPRLARQRAALDVSALIAGQAFTTHASKSPRTAEAPVAACRQPAVCAPVATPFPIQFAPRYLPLQSFVMLQSSVFVSFG